MSAVPRPRTEYRIELGRDGTFQTERGHVLEVPRPWTPEHMLLAALTRCSLLALEHHARLTSIEVEGAGGATGSVDRRPDGIWAFVDIECSLDVTLRPAPEDVTALLERAERGCFVGSSLAEKPRYRWRVNGAEVQ